MNALIVFPEELLDGRRVVLSGERASFLLGQQKWQIHQALRVSVLGRCRANAAIERIENGLVQLSLDEPLAPRPRMPVTVFVAVPRPQTVKKVISVAVQCGIEALTFVKSYHSIPSYLQSHSLYRENIECEAIKALEQVWDCFLPKITVIEKMNDFFAEAIPEFEEKHSSGVKLLAEPEGRGTVGLRTLLDFQGRQVLLGIGPEGGWSESEQRGFQDHGFHLVHLADREFRVETALTLFLGQLQYVL